MSTTMALVLVLTFAYVVGRLLERGGLRALPTTAVYALVGVAVGPWGLHLVTGEIVATLQPFLSLLLGLVGFVMGLSLRRRMQEARGLEAGALCGGWVIAAVAMAVYGFLWLAQRPASPHQILWPALALGASAAVSDRVLIRTLAERVGARGPVRELLRTVTLASSLLAVCVFGGSLALVRARDSSEALGLTPTEWLLASSAVGVACGLLFTIFLGRWGENQRTFLATVAVVTFASGLAAGIGVSPLLVGLIGGLTVSVFSRQAGELADVLAKLERPAVSAILVFAGAMWAPPEARYWLLPVLYAAVRLLALRSGGWAAPRLVGDLPRAPRLGDALLHQGALAVAIAANFVQVFPEQAAVVLTTVVGGLILSDLMAYGAVRAVLADAGEIVHRGGGAAPEGADPGATDPVVAVRVEAP
ncbi:MAG: hypothetical protein ABIO70_00535 [Pseudomonadota bacterium]